MEVATRCDVLMLELTACSPGLFTYADRQLLKSREPDAIERLVERKLRRLRWNRIAAFAFMATFSVQSVVVAVASGRWADLTTLLFWIPALAIYAGRVARDRVQMREAGERLVAYLAKQRAAALRAM